MKDREGMNALLRRLDKETDKIDGKIHFLILRLWEWGIERISDDVVRKSVSNYYLARVPFQFFISSCSSTTDSRTPHSKKKHPDWHTEAGGIVRHIIECCIEANRLLTLFGYERPAATDLKREEKVDSEACDIVLAATLITDTQKNGSPWGEKTVKNHGEIAARLWKRVAIGCDVPKDIREQIAEAVFWHYGRYTPAEPPKRFQDLPDLVQIVNLLDANSANYDKNLIYRPVEFIPSPESLT